MVVKGLYGYAAVERARVVRQARGARRTGTAVRFDHLASGVSARPSCAGTMAVVEADQLPG